MKIGEKIYLYSVEERMLQMKKIYKDRFCPFKFNVWYFKNIKEIFCGNSCVMAISDDGEILQKVTGTALAARTEYWNNIKSIAISQHFPALAVGLLKDGTCIVSKRALRNCCFRCNFRIGF